jgi:hypothetical protein
MLTESYTAALFGIDSKYYTNEFITYLWEQSANKEYQNSGIFVSALVEVNSLVCGEIRGCDLGETAHLIRVSRNPTEYTDEEKFKASFLNVLYEVRQKLDYPYMTLGTDKTDIVFFAQP